MRIVFMGTPDFAVPSLDILIKNDYNVVCVITQPDKPKGRGKRTMPPPVKEYALQHGIRILQPDKLKKPEYVELLKEMHPDLYVTCAFGQILSKEILEIPTHGCINVHGSLLPKYRGAGPINWVIINGEKKTGITTMLTNEGLDTGNILIKSEMDIDDNMTAGELHDRMSLLGAEVLLKTVKCLEACSLNPIPQKDCDACYAPMIKKNIGCIDWTKQASEIHNLVRGTNPWPGAYTFCEGTRFRVWRTKIIDAEYNSGMDAGTIIRFHENGMIVQTGKGSLLIQEIQCDNGKRMSVEQYVCGHTLAEGDKLG